MRAMSLETVKQKVIEIQREIVAREAPAVDRDCKWPEAGLRALQQAGLGGLVIGSDCGGLGHGLLALTQVCEILAQECGSTALCFGMHTVASAVIEAKATADQKERYLVPIAAGRHLTTLALSEPGTGAHFYFPETRLSEDPAGGFRVVGSKSFVTNGGYADSYVISTKATDPAAPPDQFSCVMVKEGAPGLRWGEPWNGLGMRGNASRQLEIDHVHISRGDLLGEHGDQMWYVFNVVGPYFLVAMAGSYLGIADTALKEVAAHLGARRYSHNASSLDQNALLQHRLGVLWASVERTRRLVYYAAAEGDAGGADALPAIFSAKAEVADCAVSVINEAMTLLGGITYGCGSNIERLLRDARAAHVMAPTTDLLRTWTGRVLLGQPLLGE
jgi:alkylation response protein AidB-like acyl-CoA dehydrogenase